MCLFVHSIISLYTSTFTDVPSLVCVEPRYLNCLGGVRFSKVCAGKMKDTVAVGVLQQLTNWSH